MDDMQNLAGYLLIAMPGMEDPNFHHSVTYICEHSEKGALGIVINKPMNMELGEILRQLSLETASLELINQPVLRGGPVQAERGFVLHDSADKWDATTEVGKSIFVTTSQDILTDMAAGKGPEHMLMALGYAGWDAGQLEAEIRHNAWLTVPASPELIFHTPYHQRWKAAAESIGINLASLSPEAGNACPGFSPVVIDGRSGARPPKSLLAIDFGLRRMGVASGSFFTETATALQTLPAQAGTPDWQQLDRLVAEWGPDVLVLGLPRNTDGTDSDMTRAVLEFADTLKDRYQLPVEFVDERYTSAEAESLLREQRRQGLRNKKLTKEDVDAMAARLIAESWIRNAADPA